MQRSYHPDISQLQGGTPLEALSSLTGMAYSWNSYNPDTSGQTTAYYTVTHPDLGFTGISKARFEAQFSSNGKALNPMVAWTYYTGGDNSVTGRVAAPANVRYNSDWMVANHTYAGTGVRASKHNCSFPLAAPANYVILRNPFGPTYGGKPDMNNYDENHQPLGILDQQTPWTWSPVPAQIIPSI